MLSSAEPGLREIAGSGQVRLSTTSSSEGKSKTGLKFDVIWDQGSVYFASPVRGAVGGCLLIAMWCSGTSKSVCDFVMVHSSHSYSCNMNLCPCLYWFVFSACFGEPIERT